MKSVVAVLSVLLFTSLALAQERPPAPAGGSQDTMLQGKNAPERDAGRPMCPHEKGFNPQGRGQGPDFGPNARGPGCDNARFAEMEKGNRPMWGPHFMAPRPPCPMFCMLLLFKLLFLGLIIYGTLNILLTIIVSLDMARNGRFNGLWIPVLLLAGIPGSLIYALFRIGDRMQCKSNG